MTDVAGLGKCSRCTAWELCDDCVRELNKLRGFCPRCEAWRILGRWGLCEDCNRDLNKVLAEYNVSASDRIEDEIDTRTIEAQRALRVLEFRRKYLNAIDDPDVSDDYPT